MVGRAPSATNSTVQFKLFDMKLAQNFLSVLTFPSYSAFPGVLWSPPELQAFLISCLDDVSKVLLKNTQRNQIKFQGEPIREPHSSTSLFGSWSERPAHSFISTSLASVAFWFLSQLYRKPSLILCSFRYELLHTFSFTSMNRFSLNTAFSR